MREVAIIGACETVHGNHSDRVLRDLVTEAGNGAIKDAGIDRKEIQAVYVGNYAGQEFNFQNTMGSYAATVLGLGDRPAMKLEGACASGGLAMRQGFLAVASGLYDTVLVLGVEKMNTRDSETTMQIVSRGQDFEFEGGFCVSGPSGFAMNAMRHMHDFGTTKEMLSTVAEKNYFHGSKNPYAHKQKVIPLKNIMNARTVTTPFGFHDMSLVTDASAAVVLTTKERAKSISKKPVIVKGSGHGGDYFTLSLKNSSTSFPATVKAAEEAFKMADVKRSDIDVLECHDCFTITEIINIEDLGFVEKGKGGYYTMEGHTRLGGKLPVNTSGGLKAKGHPIGATGVGQVVEMTFQLREEAEARQVKNARTAMTHVLGGPGAVSIVHILQRGY
ncbi:MAG TPA: thiolase domain-containing protein [Leptospiraceae bacterium]|nr:thiolase domain-containing protein [Leptospiraceae bacterium]HMY68710.1 thiolase domain-containing protein [Leptospiraceae bacterium]HMZ60587.1 thiolase domain-containing protein [Leptospiraceae bacterium]HNF16842.1 thiolase domain-containing protein [Leptospiraceae bacterium]HNF24046.1 thiolase domain-containing protein [Leptospiraceae bacterium]